MLRFLFVLSVTLALDARAQIGSVDTTYGSNGLALWISGPGQTTRGLTLLARPDGRCLLGSSNEFIQFTAAGFADGPFGNGGVGTASAAPQSAFHAGLQISNSAMALQPDGKVLHGGKASQGGIDFEFGRIDLDGELDPGFAGGSTIALDLGYESDACGATDFDILPDGRILVFGNMRAASNTPYYFTAIRTLADGTLDPDFGENGIFINDTLASSVTFTGRVQPDGRAVMAGTFHSAGAGILLRLTEAGERDHTFGTGGVRTFSFAGSSYFIPRSMEMLDDGRFIVAGSIASGGDQVFAIARFNADGTYDNSFGTLGRTTVGFDAYAQGQGTCLQPDGKLLVAGTSNDNYEYSDGLAVCRLLTNGTLDPAFGIGGKVLLDLFPGREGLYDVDLLPNGDILVGGTFWDPVNIYESDAFVARLLGGNTLGLIDPAKPASSLALFPNPVQGSVTLTYELMVGGQVAVDLVDAEGRTARTFRAPVWKPAGPQQETFDLHGIPAGSYRLRLLCGEAQYAVGMLVISQ